MAKELRIGVIGAGGIARTQVDKLKKIDGVVVPAAADLSQDSLARMQKEYGVANLYTDYKELLKKETTLDAITVCTPNGLHCENTVAALEAGKHVIVEKPMAMNAAECQRMNDAAKRSGKHLVVGFQWRFDPKTRMIREQVDRGDFGKVMYVRVQALRRRGIPNWGVFGRKDLQGGGPMIDIGVHCLEMAHYMMGSPKPVSATGNTYTYMGNKPSTVNSMWPNWDYKTYTVEDLAVGMIRFANGAMLSIEASFVAHIEKDVWNVNLMGEKSGANWETGQVFTDYGNTMMNMTPGYLPKGDNFEAKMRHFVEVCRDGRANESSGEDGIAVQRMLDGVYRSAEAGKEVAL